MILSKSFSDQFDEMMLLCKVDKGFDICKVNVLGLAPAGIAGDFAYAVILSQVSIGVQKCKRA